MSKTVDLLLINKSQINSNSDNLRNNKFYSARLQNSPRHQNYNPFSSRSGKCINPSGFEDLTEITTDVITEQSESLRFFPLDLSIPKLVDIPFSVNDHARWILVAPDSSYKNTQKLNEQNIRNIDYNNQDHELIFRNQFSNRFNLPLLHIDNSNRCKSDSKYSYVTLPFFKDASINNSKISDHKYDFIVPKEVLIKHIDLKRPLNEELNFNIKLNSINNSKNKFSRNIFLQNLLKVDLSSEHLSTKSSTHLTVQDKEMKSQLSKQNETQNITFDDDNTVDDVSTTDTVMHHGYIITPDFISKMKSDKSAKQILFQDIHDSQIQTHAENDFTNIIKYSPPLIIENVSILPPDMLGNLRVKNENNIKKFLSVKSVDDLSWNDFENVILSDNFNKQNEKEPETELSGHSKNVNNTKSDKFTSRILDTDFPNSTGNHYIKNNLVKSLKEMNKNIIEMEHISSGLEYSFNNSKKVIFSNNHKAKKTQITEGDSTDKIKRAIPLALVDSISSCNIETQSEVDFTEISSNEILENKNSGCELTENLLSEQMKLSNFPKLEFKSIDNDSNNMRSNQEMATPSEISNPLSAFENYKDVDCLNIKIPYSVQRNTIRRNNRNEREQKICIQRKNEAQKLALEALIGVGLPVQSSCQIPFKVINYPSPNEMMLSQLHKNELLSNVTKKHALKEENNAIQSYKPIRRVSFINKVRLQRPEITRHKSPKKPLTYVDQLMALQPKHNKRQMRIKHRVNRRIVANRNNMLLTPRSLISQDTDVISILTDWSIPDYVQQILNENSQRDRTIFNEELSQIQSLNSNSVIDWDQISEILHEHDK